VRVSVRHNAIPIEIIAGSADRYSPLRDGAAIVLLRTETKRPSAQKALDDDLGIVNHVLRLGFRQQSGKAADECSQINWSSVKYQTASF
jgi:hypothetical protein